MSWRSMIWRSRSWSSRSRRFSHELEVQPGAEGPGDGVPEAEGSEAGASTSGLGAGEDFWGVLRCPRVTLPSLEVREREAFPSSPAADELIPCLLHKVLSSCHFGMPG